MKRSDKHLKKFAKSVAYEQIEIQLGLLYEKVSYEKKSISSKGEQTIFMTSQILLIHFIYAALLIKWNESVIIYVTLNGL